MVCGGKQLVCQAVGNCYQTPLERPPQSPVRYSLVHQSLPFRDTAIAQSCMTQRDTIPHTSPLQAERYSQSALLSRTTLCPIAHCDDIKGITHVLFVPCNWFKPMDHVGDLPHLVLWLLSHSHLLPAHSQHCKGGCLAAQQILHTT